LQVVRGSVRLRAMTRPPLVLPLPSAEATAALGAWLAPRLVPGDVILLEGPIGAGKTHLARALIQNRLASAGRMEDVPSPTFTLVQVYEADGIEIWHADLYRLTHPDEVLELGLEAAFDTAICLIEWPDRLGRAAPPDALRITLAAADDGDSRVARLAGSDRWAPLLHALARREGALA
jgi:tRNA threonylcarbamoyladenosine biosynthesis protein TsaE